MVVKAKKAKKVVENKSINFKKIEEKWQKEWESKKVFHVEADDSGKKKKFYVLEMFPYPSASYLHVGHVRNYAIGDVYARFKRMNGFNVLYPIGYDSFGLPAENAAKEEGIHPKEYTESAMKQIMKYQKELGLSYDWTRVIATHEPEYYKWNQWFFLKLLEKGMAFRKKAPVNYCDKCDTVLANEEVEDSRCWRCDSIVKEKMLEQWFFKITDYAEELLKDLDKIQWSDRLKTLQRNWIGKSEGALVKFKLKDRKEFIEVFTTRADTLYGVTFLVYSAKHPKVIELIKGSKNEKQVKEFIENLPKQSDEDKEKQGVFSGRYVVHPLTNEEIPIYVSNFVVADYATGVVMAVPCHDQRDFEFAKKYDINMKIVIQPKDKKLSLGEMKNAYVSDGILVNSDKFNGMENRKAMFEITKYLESKKLGKKHIEFKIRGWLVSRQRYWGTPIPIIYCEKCGIVPVPEKDLPVLLPEKVDFKTRGNALVNSKEFVNVKCPKCGGKARRETDTMSGFMDSSWYFLRYTSNKEKDKPFDKKKVNYWMPVDQYIGGIEHAVGHLIYSRFFTKVLRDMKMLDFDEPFIKLLNQGIVYKDGAKMSKSKGNVVFQNEIADKYGIDTARLFLMFVSSPEKQMEWSDKGAEGSFRIINKLISLKEKVSSKAKDNEKTLSKLNKTIKEFTENIETFEYPKAVISLINYIDYLSSMKKISKESYEVALKLISPFCPHVAEEMWHEIGNKTFISVEKWPDYDFKKINEKFEQEDKLNSQLVDDINNILKIIKEKQNKEAKKVYVYCIPKELESYNKSEISKRTNLPIEIFSVADKNKKDPEGKSSKAKPGKPAIYVE